MIKTVASHRRGRKHLTLFLAIAVSCVVSFAATHAYASVHNFTKDWTNASYNVWYLHDSIHNYDLNRARINTYNAPGVCEKTIDDAGNDNGSAQCGDYAGYNTYCGCIHRRPLVIWVGAFGSVDHLFDDMGWP